MGNRVFVVEDHEDMRLIYRRIFSKTGWEVCGEVAAGEQAIKQVPAAHPDFVLIDISLPGMDGIELARRLRTNDPHLCVMLCTGHDVSRFEQPAHEVGVDTIVSKEDMPALLTTLRDLRNKSCGPAG